MTKKILLTILAMVCISFVDFNSDEVQSAALLIVIFSFVAGFFDSKNAWAYAISIGSSIFLGNLFFKAAGMYPKDPNINIASTYIALIPAFIGAYLGALARYIYSTFHTDVKVN
ncbi:hypothetical protein BH10BAC5_BH10BAC5_12910 [soil metagenome]